MNDVASLIEPQIPALRRYAYALTRDHAAADDLVQDCLERAIGRWYLRQTEGDLRAWLFTILHNLFVSAYRQRRRRPIHETFDKSFSGIHVGSSPANQEGVLLGRDILAQFATLSDEHQAVLLLVAIEGLPYASVARVLEVPVGTVMSRLSRAREQLRRQLEGERPNLRRVK